MSQTATRNPDAMSTLDFIMACETDMASLTVEQFIDGMAEMIRTNIAFNLQGSWGRTAASLIEGGYIDRSGNVLTYPDEKKEEDEL